MDTIRVIHVDDEPDFGELVSDFLEMEDEHIEVVPETNADDALSRIETTQERVDCLISDYDMPGMDGIEFLETVRENHPDIPFILYTGKGSEEVASTAMSKGATDYLQKGSGTEQYELLANRVRNAVELTRAQRERKRHLDAIETTQEGIAIFNDDGEMIYVNNSFAGLYGYDPEEMIGEHWELIYRDEDISEVYDDILPTLQANGHWRGETIGVRSDGSTFVEDHTLALSDGGEVVCTIQDITEQKDRRRELKEKERRYTERLNALHSAIHDLVTANTPAEVAQCGIQAASNVLGFSISAVFFESDDELESVAISEGAETIFETVESLKRGEAAVWNVYESGEPLHTTNVAQLDPIHNPDTPISSEMIIPLGDYGVLLAGSQQEGVFSEDDYTLAQILGKNIEVTLDRVVRGQ